MKWFRRKPPPPAIPVYPLPPIAVKAKEEPGIIVDEMDTSQMTRTGVFRAWDKLTGRLK